VPAPKEYVEKVLKESGIDTKPSDAEIQLRLLELNEVDRDLLVAGAINKLNCDPERIMRAQMMRYLRRMIQLLEQLQNSNDSGRQHGDSTN
jgi:hypothetical protein